MEKDQPKYVVISKIREGEYKVVGFQTPTLAENYYHRECANSENVLMAISSLCKGFFIEKIEEQIVGE